MANQTYRVLELPRLYDEDNLKNGNIALAQRYRAFRLHALKTEPAAFVSLYQEEEQKPLQHTFDRLTNTKARHFVIVVSSAVTEEKLSNETERALHVTADHWYGMIVLLGPSSSMKPVTADANPISQIGSGSASAQELDHELRFHLNGVFVSHEVRGRGLAKLLLHHAIEKADEQAEVAHKDLSCSIIVDENNVAASSLYLQCGFEVVAKQEYTKRRVVDGGLVEEQWSAITMQLRRERG